MWRHRELGVCAVPSPHFFGERLPSNRDPSVVVAQSCDLRGIVCQ